MLTDEDKRDAVVQAILENPQHAEDIAQWLQDDPQAIDSFGESHDITTASFADHRHLVQKEIVDKNGVHTHRWVDPNSGHDHGETHPATGEKAGPKPESIIPLRSHCGITAKVGELLGRMGAAVGHVEHSAKSYIQDKVAGAIARLPAAIQPAVQFSFHAVRAGTAAAFASFKLSQHLAERIAIERGATPEQARRLRSVLATSDVLAMKPVMLAAHSVGMGLAASAASSFVPPATAGYLAYSTARDPLAVARAASGLVKDAVHSTLKKVASRFAEESAEQRAATIADALQQHDYSDWYIALLSAGIDETEDVARAIEVANAAFESQPEQPSEPGNADSAEESSRQEKAGANGP